MKAITSPTKSFLLIIINLSVMVILVVLAKSDHDHHGHHHHQHHHHEPKSEHTGTGTGPIHKSKRFHPGQAVEPSTIGFMAVLYNGGKYNDRSIFCSAVIIDKKHLLTAAHCVADRSQWKNISILPANIDFNSRSVRKSMRIRKIISDVQFHPRYHHSNTEPYFDVAIIRLNSAWALQANRLNVIHLPPPTIHNRVYYPPFKAYGHVETPTHGRTSTRRFRNAHVNVMEVDQFLPQSECVNHLHILWVIYDQYEIFCVKNPIGTNPERMDAGGPLIGQTMITEFTLDGEMQPIVPVQRIDPILLGIRSVGNVHVYYYVNITTVMPWINQIMRL